MNGTYRAIEISKPGVFTEVSRPLQDPGPNQVRIRVEACGVCHTDSALVNGELPNLTYPRVPGHEVIGRIDAVGSNVKSRSVGQRVGVGICGGWDDTCVSCLRGDFVNCANAVLTGIMIDGGYAEVMIIDARSTVTIPDGLESAQGSTAPVCRCDDVQCAAECRLACGWARRDPRRWRTRSPWDSVREKDGIQDRRHWSRSGVGETRKGTRRARIHRQRGGRCGS